MNRAREKNGTNGENEKRSRQADRFRDVIIKRASEEEEEEEWNQIVKRETTDNGNGSHCGGK